MFHSVGLFSSTRLFRLSRFLNYRRMYVCLLLIFVTVSTIACSSNEPVATEESGSGDKRSHEAVEWLEKARIASQAMNKYSFELQMSQQLSGQEEADESTVKLDMQGRVERDPLKLDQTLNTVIDGEATTLRSIVIPDAYYMYMPEYEEWSKLSKDLAKQNIETLSDFQVNPDKAIEAIQALGGSLQAERVGEEVAIRYKGTGAEAKAYLAGILESTIGLSSAESGGVLESLHISAFTLLLTIDAKKHWPLSYRIESAMAIEFEPGHVTELNQTLAGAYSKHNDIAPVTVPKEAEQAIDPDKMEEELELDLENLNS